MEKPILLKISDYNKKIKRETRLQNFSAIATATAQALQQLIVYIEEVDYSNNLRTAVEMTSAARQAF
jgi:hypothetical protein